MATYLVVPDEHAGWKPYGRDFSLLCAAVAAIGLLSWLSLHGHLGAFQPNDASGQVFFSGLVWLGVAGFCLMALIAIASLSLSGGRGTVSVTGEGVTRVVESRTYSLAWSEIEGIVPMQVDGVTLLSAHGKYNMDIPRSLDDYRACIAEIKDHGIRLLPPSSLKQKQQQKTSWKRTVLNYCRLFFFFTFVELVRSADVPHLVRIAGLIAAIAVMVWMLKDSTENPNEAAASRWIGLVVVFGFFLYIVWRMTLTW